MPDVDDYFATLDGPTRAAFTAIRDVVLELAPEAEQATSYGMAALRYRRKPLLGFLATAKHLSIFPFSPSAIDAVRDRLDGSALSKGTIRFTLATPLPDDVVRDLVRFRIAEITGAR